MCIRDRLRITRALDACAVVVHGIPESGQEPREGAIEVEAVAPVPAQDRRDGRVGVDGRRVTEGDLQRLVRHPLDVGAVQRDERGAIRGRGQQVASTEASQVCRDPRVRAVRLALFRPVILHRAITPGR